MWWFALLAGVAAVGVGLVQLATFFRGGLSDRNLAQTGPAAKLVRAAGLVTGGLFLSFFSAANLVARSAGAA